MTDTGKRIEQLERRAAEAILLAKLAGDPAKRVYNEMFAENLLALVKILRTPGVAARAA